MALGVGAAVFTGYGVAWADDSPSADAGPKVTRQHAERGSSASDNNATRAKKTRVSSGVVSSGGAKGGSNSNAADDPAAADQVDNTVNANSFTGVAPSATASRKGSTTQLVIPAVAQVAPATSAPVPAPATATVSGLVTAAATGLADRTSGGSPITPVDSPLGWALLALSRRQSTSAAATANQAASQTSSLVTANVIPVSEDVQWVDGILRGNVTNPGSSKLLYTLVSAPSLGGKVRFVTDANGKQTPAGDFTYLPDASTLVGAHPNEQFSIMVSQVTGFDSFVTSIPLLGGLAGQVIVILHRTPILGTLLSPIIGEAAVVKFDENPYALSTGKPTAFTTMVPGVAGAMISVNYFPAVDVATGLPLANAPTILNGPGLASPGQTDPDAIYGIGGLTPGVGTLRTGTVALPGGYTSPTGGYNVITWDPRGEFDSTGILQLDNPAFEGQDVHAIINWALSSDNPAQDQLKTVAGDPLLGMVGGSYGGGIQLVTAGTDPKNYIDAIVPGIAWNSLNSSLYPNNAFKTSYASLLLLSLVTTGARINNLIYQAVLTGDLLGFITQTAQSVLTTSGPGPNYLLPSIDIPTLYIQGTVDVLFTLQQAIDNAMQSGSTDQRMIWYCGGHGVCLTDQVLNIDSTGVRNVNDTLKFLDKNVAGEPVVLDPTQRFQYVDQVGNWFKSSKLPSDPTFYGTPVQGATDAKGGLLGIVPLLGGSGPAPQASLPYSLGLASDAKNAINVNVDTSGFATGDQIVGAPTLSFDYQGLGTSRFVYAQLVDNDTGLVLGNLVTPVPVTLDGRSHTATINMENVVYTVGANPNADNLTLQITSSATAYENFTSVGLVNVSKVNLSLPTPATVTPEP